MQLRDELALLAWAFTATGETLLPGQLLGRQPALDGFRMALFPLRVGANLYLQ